MPFTTPSGTYLAVDTPFDALNELAKIEGYDPDSLNEYCKTLSARAQVMYGGTFATNPETLAEELAVKKFFQKS